MFRMWDIINYFLTAFFLSLFLRYHSRWYFLFLSFCSGVLFSLDSLTCCLFLSFCWGVISLKRFLSLSLFLSLRISVSSRFLVFTTGEGTLKMFFLKRSAALWFFKFVSAFFKAFCNSFFSLLILFIVSFINLIRFSKTLYLFLSLILFLNNCELWISIFLQFFIFSFYFFL